MAGAGYKLFTTGSVLTAAEVNTYLQEQTVMVFASAAARTTALSAVLSEGMVSYLKDTNALEVYDGSSWVASAAGDITNVSVTSPITGGGASGSVTIGWDSAVGNQSVESAQTASYTLVIGDAGKLVTMSNASANNLTVPPNSSVAFATGTRIDVIQKGAGQTTLVAGSGVTINSKGSALKLSGQYAGCSLIKYGTDTWFAVGDLTA
jgi:hypothetical protein